MFNISIDFDWKFNQHRRIIAIHQIRLIDFLWLPEIVFMYFLAHAEYWSNSFKPIVWLWQHQLYFPLTFCFLLVPVGKLLFTAWKQTRFSKTFQVVLEVTRFLCLKISECCSYLFTIGIHMRNYCLECRKVGTVKRGEALFGFNSIKGEVYIFKAKYLF